jgi:hypothetical protein
VFENSPNCRDGQSMQFGELSHTEAAVCLRIFYRSFQQFIPTHGHVLTVSHSLLVQFGLYSLQFLVVINYTERKLKLLRKGIGNLDKRLSFFCTLIFSALEDILQKHVCGHP